MALPKLMQDIFENNGAGPKFLEGKVPKNFSEAISAPRASFTGNVSATTVNATTVNATSLVATGESNLGFTRIRGAGCLFAGANGSKGLGMSADLPDGTCGAIVSVRNANDPQNPGGIDFYTRSPESGSNVTHGMQFRNDGSLLLDGKKMVYVTDTKVSSDGTMWYRKYSDGWIEQGGWYGANKSASGTMTFPVAFSTTNITVTTGVYLNGNNAATFGINSVSTTGFTYAKKNQSGEALRHASSWFACGY